MSGVFRFYNALPNESAPSLKKGGRKRSRAQRTAVFVMASAVVFASLCSPVAGFSLHPPQIIVRKPLHLQASAKVAERPRTAPHTVKRQRRKLARADDWSDGGSSSAVSVSRVQPLKPRKQNPEDRKRALKAKKGRAKMDSALDGVDAQMLKMLDPENFLYSQNLEATIQAVQNRPKGRPECVPGAMTHETMMKYRERRDIINNLSKHPSGSSSIYGDSSAPTNDLWSNGSSLKGVKGDKSSSSDDSPKKRKRVVKSLPQPRSEADKAKDNKQRAKKRPKGRGHQELHKYYRTELLSADEEYSLGMKVNFMMKCELVHEGLSAHLMRLPTIQEWAEACGFTEEDPDYVPLEGDEQIRPAGSEAMFEEADPNTFVGNGLAHQVGPGRGRGRVKKPPPLKLKDFYDDSELRAANRGKNGEENYSKKSLKPINRGTVKDFVEMMLTSKEAKQRMVHSNMRLVVSIARKYSNVGVSLPDLVQEGSLGLSRAAEKFEPSKGFKFSTYASWWIQQAVFRSIAYHSRTIRLPVHVHNLLNRIRKVRGNLERELGRPPSNDEMAESLDLTLEKYNNMLRLTRRSVSLEVPKYQSNPKDLGHESEDLLGDTIDSNSVVLDEHSAEVTVNRNLFHDDLKEMLKILDDDERRVITARYGLLDGLTRTVTSVASQMKESKAWVRSQECRALRKLRRPWYEKKLKEHQDALSS